MSIILLGGTGLAGQAILSELLSRGNSFKTVARTNADIEINLFSENNLSTILNDEKPDVVINAAAMVNIEECKHKFAESWNINCRIPSLITHWCSKNNKSFIQISTDHFFNQTGKKLNNEESKVSLLNEYALQKYAAERVCLTSPNSLVIRTSIVGLRGWKDLTFAEWAIKSIFEGDKINLFEDAWTSSLDVESFARAALDLFFIHNARGLFNIGSNEVYSKADFIRELALQLNKGIMNYKSCSIHDFLEDRPSSLGLDITKTQNLLNWKLPGLKEVVSNIIRMRKFYE